MKNRYKRFNAVCILIITSAFTGFLINLHAVRVFTEESLRGGAVSSVLVSSNSVGSERQSTPPDTASELQLCLLDDLICPNEFYAYVTQYSSYESCVDRRCITTSGAVADMETVACPRAIPFGTKIFIPGVGERICKDRTALRFDGRYDVFAGYGEGAYREAREWGIKKVSIIKL